ncbi:MAG: AtpZ/AtpI family protein [Candidatus Izemoplasma sp.]|nr:AtpZ/AtpI family protein [Candidatus Izemoplasma sp.]
MKEKDTARLIALVSAFAFEMVVLIGGLFFIGRFLDTRFDSSPLFTILLALIAIVAGILRLIKRANDLEDNDG